MMEESVKLDFEPVNEAIKRAYANVPKKGIERQVMHKSQFKEGAVFDGELIVESRNTKDGLRLSTLRRARNCSFNDDPLGVENYFASQGVIFTGKYLVKSIIGFLPQLKYDSPFLPFVMKDNSSVYSEKDALLRQYNL